MAAVPRRPEPGAKVIAKIIGAKRRPNHQSPLDTKRGAKNGNNEIFLATDASRMGDPRGLCHRVKTSLSVAEPALGERTYRYFASGPPRLARASTLAIVAASSISGGA